MRAAYKYRVYPDPAQAHVLNRTFGCVRVVWNRTLAWRRRRYHADMTETTFTQASAYLTAMKATGELTWLNEVSSVPLQQAIRHQQAAYAAFFAKRARYPRFRSRNGRQSAEYTRFAFRWRDGRLHLAKMSTPLAFTQKGSANRAKAKAKAARAHRKVRAARAGFLHKASTSLVPSCGTRHDRDHNAAKNILAAGLAVAGGQPPGHACGADVRHSGSSRVRSAVKQEPRPVRAGIPVHQGGE